jgi:hypothetical protein
MTKPNRQDAELLLRALEVYESETMVEARRWLKTVPDGLTWAQFQKRYPRGSRGYENFQSIIRYWETVGSLMRRGVLRPDLSFDTFLDGPPWAKCERIVREWQREDPHEAENFAWVAREAKIWKERRARRHR